MKKNTHCKLLNNEKLQTRTNVKDTGISQSDALLFNMFLSLVAFKEFLTILCHQVII